MSRLFLKYVVCRSYETTSAWSSALLVIEISTYNLPGVLSLRERISKSRPRSWAGKKSVFTAAPRRSCQCLPWPPSPSWSDPHYSPTGFRSRTGSLLNSLIFMFVLTRLCLSDTGQRSIRPHGEMSSASSLSFTVFRRLAIFFVWIFSFIQKRIFWFVQKSIEMQFIHIMTFHKHNTPLISWACF